MELFLRKIFLFCFQLLLKLLPKSFISKQLSFPSGWFGKYVIGHSLKLANTALYNFMLDKFTPHNEEKVLDVGFGPGQLFDILHKRNVQCQMCGVEISKEMINKVSKQHLGLIDAGRLRIVEAGISEMPLKSNSQDIVYTANTLYFWPDPTADIAEVYRVIAPGGTFIMGFTPKEKMVEFPLDFSIFNTYTKEDVTKLLKTAGFINVEIHEEPDASGFKLTCIRGCKQ